MAIRHANNDDIDDLLPLMRGYAEFYESNPPDEGLIEMARAAIAAPETDQFFLVAEDGDEIVGFAHCQWKWSSLRGARIVFLDDLYVRESARGEGHADALIGRLAEIAKQHGAPAVEWLTGTDNLRAQTVYNRVGGSGEPLVEYSLDL